MQDIITVSRTHVKARREALGLSLNDLAARLSYRGLTIRPQAISKWERGQREFLFTAAQINLLADALRCTPNELTEEQAESDPVPSDNGRTARF